MNRLARVSILGQVLPSEKIRLAIGIQKSQAKPFGFTDECVSGARIASSL
jgi:hypothetical protein